MKQWIEDLSEKIIDYGNGIAYDLDPKRYNGTGEQDIIDLVSQLEADVSAEYFDKGAEHGWKGGFSIGITRAAKVVEQNMNGMPDTSLGERYDRALSKIAKSIRNLEER